MEFTDWFNREEKPLHVGVYEVRRKPNGKQIVRWFSHWDGKQWSYTAQTPDKAFACRHKPSHEANRDGGFQWRGVRRKKFRP